MRDLIETIGKAKPARMLGVMILLVALAGSCTGKGCSSCSGCKSCQREPGGGPGAGGPGTGQPGKTPGAGSNSPFHPVSVLDSATGDEEAAAGQTEQAKKLMDELIAKGEGDNPPKPPTGLSGDAVEGTMVSLSWIDNAADETEYQVDRSSNGEPYRTVFRLAADSKKLTDGPLQKGSHAYRVRAVNAGGASPFAGPVTVALEGAMSPPAAPVALAAAADPSLKVVLIWEDQANNEEYFRLERSDGGGAFSNIGWMAPDTGNYTDGMVAADQTYSYRVIAGNKAGESAPSNVATATVTAEKDPPAAPANLRVKSRDAESVTLQWDDNSDNEDSFLIEQCAADQRKFRPFTESGRDESTFTIEKPGAGEEWKLRVRAKNIAGTSDPSNEVTVAGEDSPAGAYILTVDPSGAIEIIQPGEGAPILEVKSSTRQGNAVVAEIAVKNNDPNIQLENVCLLVESSDQEGVTLSQCDRGPESCSVDEGISAGSPVGYQYVEGGYRKDAPNGGELEYHPTRDSRFAVRDIWPACGSVTVKWTMQDISAKTTLGVNLYADFMPADFRSDPRFDNNMILLMIEPFTPGVSSELFKPGARQNPSSRPINFLKPGDVFAVNVSVEAGDWMESQPEIGRAEDQPNAFYIYWNNIGFAMTYDPDVIRPLSRRVVMGNGETLKPGVLDPGVIGHTLDDGWDAENSGLTISFILSDEGWVHAILSYPAFELGTGEDGKSRCIHCGQEGFVGTDGVIQGPDLEPEATMVVVYFEVVGDPGTGTPLRLSPRNDTAILLMNTNGTFNTQMDDIKQDDWIEINKTLPMTAYYPGEYQVQESYICVEQ